MTAQSVDEDMRNAIAGFWKRSLRLRRWLVDLRSHGPKERHDQQRYCSCVRKGRLREKPAQISCAIELQHSVTPSAGKLRRTDMESRYQEGLRGGTGRPYSLSPTARLILRLLSVGWRSLSLNYLAGRFRPEADT